MTRKVVIAGGGLGGLAAAIALRRQGIDAEVYEKARDLRPIGAGLSVAPNGLKALRAIDPAIVDALRPRGSEAACFHLRRAGGELVATTPTTHEERYGAPVLNLLWSRLQETLAGFLPGDAIHLGHRLAGFTQQADHVVTRFENGATVRADLLVGADGIHSAVRRSLVDEGPPRYAGRLSWRGVVGLAHPSLRPRDVTMIAGTDGKTFAIFDIGDGLTFWSAGALSPEPTPSDSAAAAKQRVIDLFAGWAPPVGDLLAATPAGDIVERPIEDRTPLTRWSHGRVTLLGDAAHAMVPALGQGANTAFEDARELARYLHHHADLTAALAAYEASRIPRTQTIHARSALQGNRYYEADSEVFSRAVLERANADQNAFEDWLYGEAPA
ncbi:NAD(P)-binding protein [Rhodovastum atsumiense]|uniref:NAD(P)-binding protein n=1 Tax=Rhodovastum atsumiense TaxID=504468 RepID=A0A5M6ILW1_9PROT|nr:FAD-dependent monooxygenase [Rhodovastum atsumiense]KAA5609182.1 NAD(P)-binding protein [Rhodovastum atsumiense]CAH2602820.1 NAD(P)-binding protein [Rhodovastum atsumiense]